MRIAEGRQIWTGGGRDMSPEDIAVIESELAAGNVTLKFADGQEWLRGEYVFAEWQNTRFILCPLTEETDEEYSIRIGEC